MSTPPTRPPENLPRSPSPTTRDDCPRRRSSECWPRPRSTLMRTRRLPSVYRPRYVRPTSFSHNITDIYRTPSSPTRTLSRTPFPRMATSSTPQTRRPWRPRSTRSSRHLTQWRLLPRLNSRSCRRSLSRYVYSHKPNIIHADL